MPDRSLPRSCERCQAALPADAVKCWNCELRFDRDGGPTLAIVGVALALVLAFAAAGVVVAGMLKTADTGVAGELSTGTPAATIALVTPTPWPSGEPGTYRVQYGDSLFSVSNATGISPQLLTFWNVDEFPGLASSPALEPGTLLALSGPAMPTPTPRPAPDETPPPAVAQPAPPANPNPPPANPNPPPASAWTVADYTTLILFRESAYASYYDASTSVVEVSYKEGCEPGRTVEECEASRQGAASAIGLGERAIEAHRIIMREHPAHPCFADGYAESEALAARYVQWFTNWGAYGDTPAGRAQLSSADELLNDTNFFLSVSDYYADCG